MPLTSLVPMPPTTVPLLPKVTFGKHRGQAWSELPGDYLSWLVNKSDMDADTKFTARHWLDQRRRASA